MNPSQLKRALAAASKPAIRDAGGDPEGVADHPDQLIGLGAALHLLTKDVADELFKHYPGFLWAVAPDQRGQVIDVFCLNFSGSWGYTIKVKDIQDDPKRTAAIAAGREILRRFRYPGTRFDRDTANNVKRGPTGEAIPDLSDMPASKHKARAELELAEAEGRLRVYEIDGKRYAEIIPK